MVDDGKNNPRFALDPDRALEFAQRWISAFNSRDLERILSLYDDDFTMSSPYIVERMGIGSGSLAGKENIRPYWEQALAVDPPLRFELMGVFAGVTSITIYYRSVGHRLVCESLSFNDHGRIISGVSCHGPPVP